MALRRLLSRPVSVRSRLVILFATGSTLLLLTTGTLLYLGFNDQLETREPRFRQNGCKGVHAMIPKALVHQKA